MHGPYANQMSLQMCTSTQLRVCLFTGMGPNIARNAIVNCTELVTYDLIKDALLRSTPLTGNLFIFKGPPDVARFNLCSAVSVCTSGIHFENVVLNFFFFSSADDLPCHFTSAFGAGFCTTVIASPVDVVKTRYMNSSHGQYSGAVNCAFSMLLKEGPMAFYKG